MCEECSNSQVGKIHDLMISAAMSGLLTGYGMGVETTFTEEELATTEVRMKIESFVEQNREWLLVAAHKIPESVLEEVMNERRTDEI